MDTLLHKDGRIHGGARTAPITMPHAAVTQYFALAVAAVALGSLSTQALSLATGRDFVFGLVPKFDPGGARNVPGWVASASLAFCAGWAAFTARACIASSRGVVRWTSLSVLLGLLSLDRVAVLGEAVGRLAGAEMMPRELFLILTAALTALYAACLGDVPPPSRQRFAIAGAAFIAGTLACRLAAELTPASGMLDRIPRVLLMICGRMLELAGAGLFVHAAVNLLRRRARFVTLAVDATLGRVVVVDGVANGIRIRLSPERLRTRLAIATVMLLTGSLAVAALRVLAGWHGGAMYAMFYVDLEGNLPTWSSSMLLLGCAGLAAAITGARHHAGNSDWRQWGLFTLALLLLSVDEAASFHELSVHPLRVMLGGNAWLRYPLIVPGVMVLAAAGVVFTTFFRGLPPGTRRAITRAALLFFSGALGIEVLGGWFDPTLYGENMPYVVLATIEEACEFGGVLVLLHGLLRHVDGLLGQLQYVVRRSESIA